MCTTSIWGTRQPVVLNATARNRGSVASGCLNSAKTDLIGVRNELRRPQVSATLLGAGAVTCGAIGYAVRGLLRKSQ